MFIAVQFGMTTESAGAVGGMLAANIASMLSSCGDYIAYAQAFVPHRLRFQSLSCGDTITIRDMKTSPTSRSLLTYE